MKSPRNGNVALLVSASLLLFVLALASLWKLASLSQENAEGEPLVVYCAAGIRPAVEPILQRYAEEHGQLAILQVGPSGGLESQIRLSGQGDLFIPAAMDPYLSRLERERYVTHVVPIARMKLVIAQSIYSSTLLRTIEAIDSLPYGLCNEQAAAGYWTKRALGDNWEHVRSEARASFATVTELAEALRSGGQLQAAIMWDATAQQFGLPFVVVPELKSATAEVGVGVLASSKNPKGAAHLAAFLANPLHGGLLFSEQHYTPIGPESLQNEPLRATIKP